MRVVSEGGFRQLAEVVEEMRGVGDGCGCGWGEYSFMKRFVQIAEVYS